MKRYKAASILMLIHGAFMEVGGCLCLIPALLFPIDTRYQSLLFFYRSICAGSSLYDEYHRAHLWNGKNHRSSRVIEKSNMGTGPVGHKLRYNHGSHDIYAARWYNGRNFCL